MILRVFVAAYVLCVSRCVFLRFVFAGRVVKEKGEPRGGNDHGAFPLVSLGQMSAAGCTRDPRFLSGGASLFFNY